MHPIDPSSRRAARLTDESEGIETEPTSSTTASPTELPSLRASLNLRSPGNRLLGFQASSRPVSTSESRWWGLTK
jgi:hypothetical protein